VYEVTIKSYLDEMMGWSEDQHRAMIRSNFAGGATHFAIVVDGVRAGIVRIAEHDEAIALEQIALLPQFQGKGIGTALIESLIEQASTTCKAIDLSVFVSNLGARRLYERLGFQVVSESNRDIKMRYTPQTG
jgi:ribosomal protein S18 acetylase RimI-like enzyme